MTDVNALGIEYGRRWIYTTRNANVNVTTLEEERRACEYLIRGLGYRLMNRVDLPPEPGKPKRWCLCFCHFTPIADTDQGDAVTVDGRYEVKDA